MSKTTFPVTMGRSGIQMIENFNPYDHVWGLCNLNRFCGKGDRQVSVAAHSLHCLEIAKLWQPDNTTLHYFSLLHDLPEAYTQDVPGFLKPIYGPEFKDVNDKIDEIIFSQMGLTSSDRIVHGSDLHRVDTSALTIEASYVFDKFEPYHWPPVDLYEKTDIITNWTEYHPVGMYNLFINVLNEFGNDNEILRNTLRRHTPRSHPSRGPGSL